MRVVCDAEGDGLVPTKFWCVVCKDVDTGKIYTFSEQEVYTDFLKFAKGVTLWIMQNGIAWDLKYFKQLLNLEIPLNKLEDTLVLSKMAKPKRVGGHSVDNWGTILGRKKPKHEQWDRFSPEMLFRCQEDVEITFLMWKRLKKTLSGFSTQSIRMEHKIAQLCVQQEENGFKLDVEKATKLFAELSDLEVSLREAILKDFPPQPKAIKKVVPRITKKGEISKIGLGGVENVEGEFTLVEFEEFNLGSPKQIIERLNKVGWKPVERTPGYNKLKDKLKNKEITKEEFEEKAQYTWTVSEENLSTIPPEAPESAKNLARWKMISSRKTLVETWLKLADEKERIHGRVDHLGTWTHRCSHYDPNMANIPGLLHDKKTGDILYGLEGSFGFECRDCWTTDKGRILLGVDAKGIQLRALAHYVGNSDYIQTVVSGDPHQYHADILAKIAEEDVVERSVAKTFIYAYILGAGNAKVSQILGKPVGAKVKQEFPQYLPGLEDLMARLDKDAEQGYTKALDGRLIALPSRHKALACYLQSFEKIIMSKAMCNYTRRVKELNLDAFQVAWVHDEFQIDTVPEQVEQVGKLVIQAIRDAGEFYNVKCPMDGDMRYGKSWAYTH